MRLRRVCAFDHGVLRELAGWPNGSGAVVLVMPGTALRSLEGKGLAEVVREDACGPVWRITAAGLARLEVPPSK